MIKYNDNNIIVGYIKNLLHDFNLPSAKVYKDNMPCYKNKYYIYNNKLVKCKLSNSSQLIDYAVITDYKWNKYIPNYTSNLPIDSIYYDSKTHKALGDYLRLLRDYKNINLMQLYNCFNSEVPSIFKFIQNDIYFNTEDDSYKYYIVPIKLDKSYTIALEGSCEIMYCLYGDIQVDNLVLDGTKLNNILQLTYKKYDSMRFSTPVLYEVSLSDTYRKLLSPYENQLKLIIKLPHDLTSTITILEGDYRDCNSYTIDSDGSNLTYNSTIFNLGEDVDYSDFLTKSSSQLLWLNCGESHPFADKLIGYLLGNVIDSDDKIMNNVLYVQKTLQTYCGKDEYDNYKFSYVKKEGLWQDEYKQRLYMLTQSTPTYNKNAFDILGYVDKDVEMRLASINDGKEAK